MMLNNSMGEITRYSEKNILSLFDDLTDTTIIFEEKKIKLICQNKSLYPNVWMILNPTKKIIKYFKGVEQNEK